MELSGSCHAFISGGASGIGLGIGDALAKRGVKVTLADCDTETLAEVVARRGKGFRGVSLDVRDRAQWLRARAEAETVFGPADLLVNNAGIAPDGRELADSVPESFERIIAINLMGVYNGVFTFAAQLRAARRGHIVNVASMAALSLPPPGTGAYVTSKFAVLGLSEALRNEMAPFGVGVSVMCPGLVATNLPQNTIKVGGSVRAGGGPMPAGLDPGVAGEMAARAIERDEFYVLTHFDRADAVAERFRAIEAAFRRGPDPDLR